MRAAIGSQCKLMNRGIFGNKKTILMSMFMKFQELVSPRANQSKLHTRVLLCTCFSPWWWIKPVFLVISGNTVTFKHILAPRYCESMSLLLSISWQVTAVSWETHNSSQKQNRGVLKPGVGGGYCYWPTLIALQSFTYEKVLVWSELMVTARPETYVSRSI